MNFDAFNSMKVNLLHFLLASAAREDKYIHDQPKKEYVPTPVWKEKTWLFCSQRASELE
jgi:hypothetical protein